MNTQSVSVSEANANLSRLLEQVESGAVVFITKGGKPMARVSRIDESKSKIRFGVLKGNVKIFDDFDAPLPEDILLEFEGIDANID
jgi:prevent-host-death family protein